MVETLRFVLRQLRPYRAVLLRLGCLSLVATAFNFVGPIVMALSIDAAVGGQGMGVILATAAVWLIIRIIGSNLGTYVYHRGDNVSHAVSGAVIREFFLRLLAQPLSFHFGSAGHKLRDQISSLRWKLSNTISNSLFSVLPNILTLVALVVYVLWVDTIMGGVLFFALVAFGMYTTIFGVRMVPLHEEWNKAWSVPSQTAGDAISNILVVKSTQSETAVRRRMEDGQRAFEEIDVRTGRAERRITDMQELIIVVSSGIIIALAGYRLQQGTLSVGTMTAVLAYAFNAFGQIRGLQYAYRSLVQVHAGREVIEQELLPFAPEDLGAGTDIGDVRGEVRFDHVAFAYRAERPILKDASFSAEAGERIAIVGESGEGKSTIVDLLGRYYDRSGGAITVDGQDIRDVSLRSLRGAMAYVPQDLTLMHDTLEENIRIGRSDATAGEIAEAIRLAQLDTFIASLPEGLATKVGERGLKLSGGERQRVALARAFLRKPAILILDEPTSNLDAKTETAVQASLRELMQGRTTFIIAHRLKTVQEMDRILVLKDGIIAESGTHAELLARKGAYYDLLRAQHLFIGPDETHLGEPPADAA